MKFITKNENETIELGKKLSSKFSGKEVVLLIGDLGTGKTMFSKGIGLGLGVKRVINSPTFTIVKEYKGDKLKFYHLDLYRLDGLNNDYDLDEYIEAENAVCAIEWPYQIEEILPKEYIKVELIRNNDERIINISSTKKYEKLVGMLNV